MKTLISLLLAVLAFTRVGAAPVKIIFDTDMDTDCDDAGAMAVLHVLADRGECEILATVVSTRHPGSVPTVAAINRYYGRPELPLGVVKQDGVNEPSKFAGEIAREFGRPADRETEVPDAAAVYRDILERQPDHSVTIVTAGYLTNLRHLLALPAEGEHPSGRSLAETKVRQFVCMGGNFIGNPPKDDLRLGNVNFQRDPTSALQVIREWPGPIVFAGREIGSVPSGLAVGTSLARTPSDNPVRRAYEYYFGGQLRDRHVADLVSVLYAVRGLRDYWSLSEPGTMELRPDMTFEWKPEPRGRHTHLVKLRDEHGEPNDRYIESVLNELVTQLPAAK